MRIRPSDVRLGPLARGFLLPILLVDLMLALVGCAPPPTMIRTTTPEERAQRLALANSEAPDDPLALARFQYAAGNRSYASVVLVEALERSRQIRGNRVLLGMAEGPGGRLDEWAVFDQLVQWDAASAVQRLWREPPAERREQWLELASRHRPPQPMVLPGVSVDDEALKTADITLRRRMAGALHTALKNREESRFDTLTHAILRVDPKDPQARLLRLMKATLGGWHPEMVITGPAVLQTIARVHESTLPKPIRLVLLAFLVAETSAADSLALAEEALALEPGPELTSIARSLERTARAILRLGPVSALDGWWAIGTVSESTAADSGKTLRLAAGRRARALFGLDGLEWSEVAALAKAGDLDDDEMGRLGRLAPVYRCCAARQLEAAFCEKLLGAAHFNDVELDPDAAEELFTCPEAPAEWLEDIEASDEILVQLFPVAKRLASTRLGLTRPWATLMTRAALAAGPSYYESVREWVEPLLDERSRMTARLLHAWGKPVSGADWWSMHAGPAWGGRKDDGVEGFLARRDKGQATGADQAFVAGLDETGRRYLDVLSLLRTKPKVEQVRAFTVRETDPAVIRWLWAKALASAGDPRAALAAIVDLGWPDEGVETRPVVEWVDDLDRYRAYRNIVGESWPPGWDAPFIRSMKDYRTLTARRGSRELWELGPGVLEFGAWKVRLWLSDQMAAVDTDAAALKLASEIVAYRAGCTPKAEGAASSDECLDEAGIWATTILGQRAPDPDPASPQVAWVASLRQSGVLSPLAGARVLNAFQTRNRSAIGKALAALPPPKKNPENPPGKVTDTSPPAGAETRAVACLLYQRQGRPDLGFGHCLAAWKAGVLADEIAAQIYSLALDNPRYAEDLGVSPRTFAVGALAELPPEHAEQLAVALASQSTGSDDVAALGLGLQRAVRSGFVPTVRRDGDWIRHAVGVPLTLPGRVAIGAAYARADQGWAQFRALLAIVAREYRVALLERRSLERTTPEFDLVGAGLLGSIDLIELGLDDVQAGRLPRSMLDGLVGSVGTSGFPEADVSMLRRFPRSRLLAVLSLLGGKSADPPLALLADRFPENGHVALALAVAADRAGKPREADRRFREFEKRWPTDPRPARVRQATGRAQPIALAKGVEAAEAWHAALAAADPSTVESKLVDEPLLAASLVVPSDDLFWPKTKQNRVTVGPAARPYFILDFVALPRETEAREVLMQYFGPSLESGSMTSLWEGAVTLPAGAGWELMAVTDDGLNLNVTVVVLGRRAYLAAYRFRPHEIARLMPRIRMLRESFRVLDHALRADIAEQFSLRLPNDQAFALRRILDEALTDPAAKPCAWKRALEDAKLGAHESSVALDRWLTDPDVARRQSLWSCAAGVTKARIAPVAILSEHWPFHVQARQLLAKGGRGVNELVSLLATRPGPDVPRPRPLRKGFYDHPRFGILELIAAVPASERQELVRRLLASDLPEFRSLALAANYAAPGSVRDELLAASVRDGDLRTLAFMSYLLHEPGKELLDAVEARLGRWEGPWTEEALRVSWDLAVLLLLKRPTAANVVRGFADRLQKAVDKDTIVARTAMAKGLVRLIESDLSKKESGKGARKGPTAEELATRPLAELAPAEWAYWRMPHPSRTTRRVAELLPRIGGEGSTAQRIQQMAGFMAESEGMAILAPEGGLDLEQPIECVQPPGRQSFLCAVSVKDFDVLRSGLASRRLWYDNGVQQVHETLGRAEGLFLGLAHTPITLLGTGGGGGSGSPTLVSERLRSEVTVGGHTVDRFTIVELRADGGAVVDTEHYVRFGDRVYLTGTNETLEAFFTSRPKRGESIAAGAPYKSLAKRWSTTGALHYIVPMRGDEAPGRGADDPPVEGYQTATLGLDNDGLYLRATISGSRLSRSSQLDLVTSAMPPGAASGGSQYIGLVGLHRDVLGPPPWLREMDLVVDWHRHDDPQLTWVAGVPAERVQKAAEKRKAWPADGGAILTVDGLHLRRLGKVLLASRNRALLEAARAPSGRRDRGTLVRFSADGTQVAELAERVAARSPKDSVARFYAALYPVVRDAHLETIRKGRRATLDGRVRLVVSEAGADLETTEQALASSEMRNAVKLPRVVPAAQHAAPIIYRFRVPDAETFARRVRVPSDRTTVTVVGPDRVDILVQPSGNEPKRALSPIERRRALASAGDVVWDTPRVRALAREIRGSETDPAKIVDAVLSWVVSELTYEIFSGSADPDELLTRKRGDCTEFSAVVAALLRASGIPAVVQSGMHAGGGDHMVAHAWAAWHDGERWHEVEPTSGENRVGSSHIEIDSWDLLLRATRGELEVIAIDPAPKSPPATP